MDSLRQKLVGLINSTKRKKPYRCEVEYVESTEKDAFFPLFPTDNMVDSTTSWEVRLSFNDVSSTGQLMGFGYSGNNRYNLGIESSKFRFAYSTTWFDAAIPTPDTNPHTWRLEPTGLRTADAYFDGQKTSVSASSDFGEHDWFVGVGGRSTSSNQIQSANAFGWKLYYSKLWKAGKLVADVIPVIDWNDKPCLYDKISGKLIYATIRYTLNTGGEYATITAGREIHKVAYLESTEDAKQWINTGYNVNTATDEIELDFQFLSDTIYKWIFGDHYGTSRLAIGSGDGAGKRNLAYGTTTYKIADKYILNTKHHYKIDSTGAYIDGDKLANYSSFTGSANLYLFSININSTSNYTTTGRFWKYSHKRNGNYLRDMYPAIDENGVGFMFDRVTHTIFDNQGTGAGFNYPPVEVEYLESTGTQYIDTGVNTTNTLGFDVKFEWDTWNTANSRFMGVIKQDGSNYLRHHSSDSTQTFQYFVSNAATIIQDPAVTGVKHDFKFNSNTRKYTFDDIEINESSSATFNTGLNYWLFGRNSNTESLKNYASLKIYSAALYDNTNTALRKFVPAIMNGRIGMYDKITKTLYENAGTGDFIAGKIKEHR